MKHLTDSSIQKAATFIAGILILVFPALYNGYPLVTSDSGAYISNAFDLWIPDDRSVTYSVFIRLTSMHISLWGVLVVQSFLLVFFIRLLMRRFCRQQYSTLLLLAIILLLTLFTSAAWFNSQLMPDAFTALLLLAICTYYFIPAGKKWHTVLLVVFLWGFIIMHNSHLVISLVTAVMALLYYALRKNRFYLQRSFVLLALSISGFLTLSTLNAISGKGFRPSSATHVFLMCRMVESGIMDEFLSENCATNDYKLCAYRNQLPKRQWDFQWNENSPLYKTGGWKANEAEYNRIIFKTLTTPKYLGMHLLKSTEATLRQVPQIQVGDGLTPQTEGTNTYLNINKYFGHESKEYLSAYQNTGGLKFGFFNVVIVLFSFITCIATLLTANTLDETIQDPAWKHLFGLVILFLLANAFTTATFSTVLGRFQSRVFWVLPFTCVLFLVSKYLPAAKQRTVAHR